MRHVLCLLVYAGVLDLLAALPTLRSGINGR